MGRLFFILAMVFFITLVVGNLWVHFIHPFLFGEAVEDKIDDAVEEKIMKEADKKAAEILEEEV